MKVICTPIIADEFCTLVDCVKFGHCGWAWSEEVQIAMEGEDVQFMDEVPDCYCESNPVETD